MMYFSEEEKRWLVQLQKDLAKDRSEERTQADPVYYAIQDRQELVTAEGYHDYVAFYDPETGEAYTEDSICELLERAQVQELLDAGVIRKIGSKYELVDKEDYIAWLDDNMGHIECIYMASRPYVVPNTMFLTRKDADDHLKCNQHHYTQYAHSYAMTGWRSPRFEHLMEVLMKIDFEQSTLVLKDDAPENLPTA